MRFSLALRDSTGVPLAYIACLKFQYVKKKIVEGGLQIIFIDSTTTAPL